MELTLTEYPLRTDALPGNQGHEPDNTLVDYYKKYNRLVNRSCVPDHDIYTGLTWLQEPRRITTLAVARFGIKTFPGIGAYGFYHTLHENRNHVIVPINNRKVKYTPPTFTMTKSERQLHFTIVQPEEDDIQYECFRVVLRAEFVATEYITYELAMSVIAPPPGTYEVYVFGYLGADKISENSEVLETIISAAESWYPDGIEYVPTVVQDEITRRINSLEIDPVDIPPHIQTTASTIWTVNHGLGFNPVCAITDSSGVVMHGTVQYLSDDILTVTFAVASTGRVVMR